MTQNNSRKIAAKQFLYQNAEIASLLLTLEDPRQIPNAITYKDSMKCYIFYALLLLLFI